MNRVEQLMQKRQTHNFVKGSEIEVQLVRKTQVATAAGGVTEGEARTLPRQRFRLTIPVRHPNQNVKMKTEGRLLDDDYMLVGASEADVQLGDKFVLDGSWYEIIYVAPQRTYETIAGVMHRGQVAP